MGQKGPVVQQPMAQPRASSTDKNPHPTASQQSNRGAAKRFPEFLNCCSALLFKKDFAPLRIRGGTKYILRSVHLQGKAGNVQHDNGPY